MKDLANFDFDKRVKAVCMQFTSEQKRLLNETYTRALVDSDGLEWIELSVDAQDDDLAQDGTGSGEDGDNLIG